MKKYKVLANGKTCEKAMFYLEELRAGKKPGAYLGEQLGGLDLSRMTVEKFLEFLIRTKRPQIFAESAVFGDGTDWNRQELSILGDIGVAVPVTVFDNGKHARPDVHQPPFGATLLFTPGALLQNGRNRTPADWDEVVRDVEIDPEGYFGLYERRLFPPFMHADRMAKQMGKMAFVTVPGLGCGAFAGPFRGRLGAELKNALARFLDRHGPRFSNIKAVYYDPYSACENERQDIHGIDFLVRPLLKGNDDKPQLCRPETYEEAGDRFAGCELFSVVAWDHVSWPGNDFYSGSRTTDDGVKAAATSSMAVVTGVEGTYDPVRNCYRPPAEYRNWRDVVSENGVQLEVERNFLVFSSRD